MSELIFTPFPTLSTERLVLRQLEDGDALEIFSLRSDERVNQFLDRERATSIEDARKFIDKILTGIRNNEWIYWVINLKDDHRLIGTIGLFNISEENLKAELGYELMPGFQGRGIMQEAISKVIDFGLTVMKLETIEAFTHENNEKSSALLVKNNFLRDFTQEKKMRDEGSLESMIIYSLTRKKTVD